MKRILVVLALAVAVMLPATAKNKTWLDGEIVALGHVQGAFGHQIPIATVVLYDPGNADPLARKLGWIIVANYATANVNMSVGVGFKAYIFTKWENYTFMVIRYLDKKGRENGDPHLILQQVGSEDLPK
ncbi:MAG: hypothetical protein ABSB35_19005 [Bryobacteraceae bacterium]|jgi:uncharacterized membrane protein AbrB (regulator of aidB expression)